MLKVVSSLLLVAILIIVASSSVLFISAEEAANEETKSAVLGVQHSLDGGKTWIERGRLDATTLEFEPASASSGNAKWTKDQLAQLRALALKKGTVSSVAESSVLVRVVNTSVCSSNKNDFVQASVAISPCSLIVPRQYTTQLSYIAERYGVTLGRASSEDNNNNELRINSLRLMNPFHDEVCEPSVFKTTNAEVKLKMSFVKAPQLKNVGFPYGGQSNVEDTGANLHSGAAARRGAASASSSSADGKSQDQAAAAADNGENKTFWEKYGTYITIFLIVQMVGSFFGPKAEKGAAKEKAE